ncbi:MAG: MG2 domain-containing protein, partial [Acidobacteriota bacterium]|nr:MG2 domain-containing protein [Acidobacteriota bacterium]
MFETKSRSYRVHSIAIIYLVAIAGTLTIATLRSRAKLKTPTDTEPAALEIPRRPSGKAFFSLSTHRTYGTSDNARLWVDYQGVDYLDFRIYQVKDPRKFFTELKNPHQMGEHEEEEVASSLPQRKSFLERVRAFKRWAYTGVKTFVRGQLQHDSRQAFNQKFRSETEPVRTPLNVSDYARVPLLNPDLLVSSWREPLPPLENEYDRRMIPLGKRTSGVYLVEAVENNLRAYTVVVVTDLTMIDKTSRDGELLVYTVDRRTGEPRPGAQVEIVKEKKTIATGVTDNQGILRTKIEKKKSTTDNGEAEPAGAEPDSDKVNAESLLILARQSSNFAISDLGSGFFDGYEGEEGGENIKGYIYSDRPVYRPSHQVNFKGIIRAIDAAGAYKSIKDNTVNVTVEDPNSATIFTQELTISPRGTFNGQLELSEEAALGSYRIAAEVDGETASGSFEVAEYKKPEYKVTVSAPGKFVQAGQKATFSIDARYFFGSPVANAEVKYYIYRSRYYAWGFGEDDADLTAEESDGGDEYSQFYGGGNDMVQESEGTLDARGRMNVEFPVPQTDNTDTSDYSYRLEAQVTDSARRTIDGSASFVATRGSTVARANPDRYVYYKGEVAKVRVTTTDYEGKPVSAKVQLQFVERSWTKKEKKTDDESSYPQYEMHEREITSAAVQTDSQGQASYDYTTSEAGNISIKTVINEGGREVASIGGNLWVTDRQYAWSDSSYYSEDYNSIKLVPDKKSYKPGEIAHVLAILPTDNAHLLVSTELTSVMSVQHVDSPGRSIVLDIPIQGTYAPNVFLNVSYVKGGDMYT